MAWLSAAAVAGLAAGMVAGLAWAGGDGKEEITVPMVLDHNRMLVNADVQRKDGTWRRVVLWVDSGNPSFFISEPLARDLGIVLSEADSVKAAGAQALDAASIPAVRIDGMPLDFSGVAATVLSAPAWLFSTTHCDANLPSTVLMHYDVIFDYPKCKFTLAAPGRIEHRGERSSAKVNPTTGIVQMDAVVGGDSLSLALDIGASYSFVADKVVERLASRYPEWPRAAGAIGCANIWGWWPDEGSWPIIRVPELVWGTTRIASLGLVGIPGFLPGGGLDQWYSKKTAAPVAGFLGPNAVKAFRVEIDYRGSAIYLEKGADFDGRDLDLVGLTVRPEEDGGYSVVAVPQVDGAPAVPGVEAGDRLIKVGNVEAAGATMGKVVDALRGKPGDVRKITLERGGKRFTVEARVVHFL